MEDLHIALVGTPGDGFTAFGPFLSRDEADIWAAEMEGVNGEPVFVVRLESRYGG